MNTDELEHLRAIRLAELDRVLPLIEPGQIVLEIGAGHGWQSRSLSERELQVVSLELPQGPYDSRGICQVVHYDGIHIPLPDQSIDVIYSANTLHQIPGIREFQQELRRVLRPSGFAIHLLPTPLWHAWTLLTFYPHKLQRILGRAVNNKSSGASRKRPHIQSAGVFFPRPNSIHGNTLTEFLFLSTRHWIKLFKSTGWQVRSVSSTGIFYTGNMLFGVKMSVGVRQRLRHVFGSVCLIYVVYPEN